MQNLIWLVIAILLAEGTSWLVSNEEMRKRAEWLDHQLSYGLAVVFVLASNTIVFLAHDNIMALLLGCMAILCLILSELNILEVQKTTSFNYFFVYGFNPVFRWAFELAAGYVVWYWCIVPALLQI